MVAPLIMRGIAAAVKSPAVRAAVSKVATKVAKSAKTKTPGQPFTRTYTTGAKAGKTETVKARVANAAPAHKGRAVDPAERKGREIGKKLVKKIGINNINTGIEYAKTAGQMAVIYGASKAYDKIQERRQKAKRKD